MNIIIHYPEDAASRRELQKRTAQVHCDAVWAYVERLDCPTEQKKEILARLIRVDQDL